MEFFLPTQTKCEKRLVDETIILQKPSLLCKIYVLVGVISVVLHLTAVGMGSEPKAAAIGSILFQFAFSYVMYRHCLVCRAWNGFFKLILLNLTASILLNAIFKKKKTAKGNPSSSKRIPPS